MRAMGARRGRLSAPWLRFHGVDRADVYIIIHVRACCCGECALNPPPSPPIPRRRPSLAPTQRHPLPEHFRSPTQPRRTPAGCAMHARRLRDAFLADRTTHSPPKTFARPRTATRPRRALPLPHAAPTHAHRLRYAFPADRTPHSPPKTFARPAQRHALPNTSAPPRSADARPPTALCIPRRSPSLAPAAPRCLPFRSASGTKKRHRTVHVRCRMSRSTVVAVGHLGW